MLQQKQSKQIYSFVQFFHSVPNTCCVNALLEKRMYDQNNFIAINELQEENILYSLFSMNFSQLSINFEIFAIWKYCMAKYEKQHDSDIDVQKLVPYSKVDFALNKRKKNAAKNN